MQCDPAYLDPTDINSTTHNPNADRWNNTRPIHIPSSPSSVASLSPPSLGSTPELSPTNLLAESENNSTSSASHLIYPTSNTLPVIPPTTTITTSTINTTQPINITSFPNMNIQMNAHVPPLYNMPIRGSKLAPKTFKGDYHKISDFIRHYNRLLDQHQVITEADKCQGILEYCVQKVKDFVRSSTHFQTPNWTRLQAEILKYYDADREESRYRVADLNAFVQRSSLQSINELADWKKYYRDYFTIAGFLKQKGLIDNKMYVGYFWYGLSPHLQKILEEKLYINYPQFDTTNPWPIDYLDEVANFYFKRNKFPQRLGHLPPAIDREDESDEDDSEYDSYNDSSDDEDTRRRRRRTKKKRTKTKVKKAPKTQILPGEPMRKISPPPEEEVEGLIQQLNSMSLDDPKYGLLYYRAVKNDSSGLITQCIRRSPKTEKPPGINQRNFDQPSRPPHTSATYPNNIPTRQFNNSQ